MTMHKNAARAQTWRAITLRHLPPEMAQVIQRRAEETGTSLNKAVIGLLEEASGLRGKQGRRVVHHDLDQLAGTWTRADARRFEDAVATQRTIDPELWR